MFTKVKYYMVIMGEDEDAAMILKLASKFNLVGLHKVGVYEDEQQDELFFKGRWVDMMRFTRELNRVRSEK